MPGVKSPDLVVASGVSEYGIEAKRPEFARNVVPRMIDARDQLNSYGLQGAVVMDVADCLRDVAGDKDAEVQRLGRSINAEVFEEGRGNRAGYSGIIMSATFARTPWTSEDGEDDSMVSVHTSAMVTIYARRRNTLQDLRARWLARRYGMGCSRLGCLMNEERSTLPIQ